MKQSIFSFVNLQVGSSTMKAITGVERKASSSSSGLGSFGGAGSGNSGVLGSGE